MQHLKKKIKLLYISLFLTTKKERHNNLLYATRLVESKTNLQGVFNSIWEIFQRADGDGLLWGIVRL